MQVQLSLAMSLLYARLQATQVLLPAAHAAGHEDHDEGAGGKARSSHPFGGAGGFPGGMPGMPQGMPGMPTGFPQQGFGAQGPAPASGQPPVDVTAQSSEFL